MNIHEYQAKQILKDFGAPVSRGIAVTDKAEARKAVEELGGPVWVVKAQIHAGGRGKGTFKEAAAGEKGGVRIATSPDDAVAFVEQMMGNTLVTHQSGAAGKQVNRIYLEEGAAIAKEFYLSLLVDRETSRISFIVSTEGGMDIEEVAASTPEKILTFSVDPATGVMPYHGRKVAKALGLEGQGAKDAIKLTAT
ncbi:MAG: ATP-grasp domain-containing protein, partial [Pseudomonadota bacterium]